MDHEVAPETPREQQTIRLPASKLASLRPWATEGTGLTAAARVEDADGRVALVQNGWSDGWLPPGGAVEPGETPAEAARREVREETGLDAAIEDPLVVFEQSYVAQDTGETQFSAAYVVFAGRASGEIPSAGQLGVDGEEIDAARWFETLPENLHDGGLLRTYL